MSKLKFTFCGIMGSVLLVIATASTGFAQGPPPLDSCALQFPGDANSSGSINILDVTYLIGYLCHSGSAPFPLANGDPDGDCDIDGDDIDYLIDYIYKGGSAPVNCTCVRPTKGSCPDTCAAQNPGDANGDEAINILDIGYLVDYLCHSGPAPVPPSNGDPDGDCNIDGDDIEYLIDYIYKGGDAPVDCTCMNPTKGSCPDSCTFQYPGDANDDDAINILDVGYLIDYLCHSGPAPVPPSNGDATGDCVIDSSDITRLIDYLYKGGDPPVDCTCLNPTKGSCFDTCGAQYPGDANDDDAINILDVTYLIDYLCHSGPGPVPPSNGDPDGDCDIDEDDVVYLIDYIYKGGDAPVDCTCMNPSKGSCPDSCTFQFPGDADGSETINIQDVTYLTNYLCYSGPAPVPPSNGDPDGDCDIDGDDIDYLMDYIYSSGPAPVTCTCVNPTKGSCPTRNIGNHTQNALRSTPQTALPGRFELAQNIPNPFNPTTMIMFSLPEASDVMLEIYSVTGQQVVTLVDDVFAPGQYSVTWNGKDAAGQTVASGLYFYRIKAGTFSDSKKMVLLK